MENVLLKTLLDFKLRFANEKICIIGKRWDGKRALETFPQEFSQYATIISINTHILTVKIEDKMMHIFTKIYLM